MALQYISTSDPAVSPSDPSTTTLVSDIQTLVQQIRTREGPSIDTFNQEIKHSQMMTQELMERRNQLAPIHGRLIPDLLLYIFYLVVFDEYGAGDDEDGWIWSEVMDSDHHKLPSSWPTASFDPHPYKRVYEHAQQAIVISHVCRRWRAFALGDARLWSVLLMTSERWCSRILKRFKTLPLDVFVRFEDTPPRRTPFRHTALSGFQLPPVSPLLRNINAVLKELSRVRNLSLEFTVGQGITHTVLSLMQGPAPNLRSLRILLASYQNTYRFDPQGLERENVGLTIPATAFGSLDSPPPLRRLSLSRVNVPWTLPLLSSRTFTSLHFSHIPNWMRSAMSRLEQLLDVLDNLPSLRSLHLEYSIPPSHSPTDARRSLAFPNMALLILHDDSPSLTAFLSHIASGIPPSCRMSIRNMPLWARALGSAPNETTVLTLPAFLACVAPLCKDPQIAAIAIGTGEVSVAQIEVWRRPDDPNAEMLEGIPASQPTFRCMLQIGGGVMQSEDLALGTVVSALRLENIEVLRYNGRSMHHPELETAPLNPDVWHPVLSVFSNLHVLEISSVPFIHLLNTSTTSHGSHSTLFPNLHTLNLFSLHLTSSLSNMLRACILARQPTMRRVGITNISIREASLQALRTICAVEWLDDYGGVYRPAPPMWPGDDDTPSGDDDDDGPFAIEPGVGFDPRVELRPDTPPFLERLEYDFEEDDDLMSVPLVGA
ncbi:hypothetical protein OF83DRAFT_1177970 [Amylostereum chailletii]|nr:hypothetical protein OF83DRAFT_1177970 [Amylostereum chailletii]